jgi:4'-phosphopantetheinyl transferase
MLASYEIHLWSLSVVKPEALRKDLHRTLSRDERERAARFHFEQHRNAYTVARGILRLILSHYVKIEPERIEFTYSAKGKPALHSVPIYFNVSHSRDVALYAVAREPKLGVDVEYVHPMPELEKVARRFFSTAEYNDLLMLDRHQRCEGFFRCWTRKEAYIKAMGDGLCAPLDQFQVTLSAQQPARFVTIQGDQTLASKWSLFDWKVGDCYAAAVAIYGRGWHLEEQSAALIGL